MNFSKVNEKISAVIVYNGEVEHITKCLERIGFCDEILIVSLVMLDQNLNFSSEKIRVISHEWVPFAEKVWSFAIGKANFDWILFADPDLYYPPNAEPIIRNLIKDYEKEGLAAVDFPYRNYFGEEPIKYGRKSLVSAFTGLVNRERVSIEGLLHHRGLVINKGLIRLGALFPANSVIEHHWIKNMGDANQKARRYLPHEGESRYKVSGNFSLKKFLKEMIKVVTLDIRYNAFLDKKSTKVMFFNFKYSLLANYEWFKYSKRQ